MAHGLLAKKQMLQNRPQWSDCATQSVGNGWMDTATKARRFYLRRGSQSEKRARDLYPLLLLWDTTVSKGCWCQQQDSSVSIFEKWHDLSQVTFRDVAPHRGTRHVCAECATYVAHIAECTLSQITPLLEKRHRAILLAIQLRCL